MWILALAILSAAVPGETLPPPSVALDMRALDSRSYERIEATGLYKSLLVRLLAEQLAVVDTGQKADVVIRFELEGDSSLLLTAHTAAGEHQRRVGLSEIERDEAQWAVIHAVVALVRASLEVGTPPPTASSGMRVPKLGAALSGGILWSSRNVGAITGLSAIAGWDFLYLTLGAVLHQPAGLPRELEITEWAAYAGLGTARQLGPEWLTARGSLAFGLLQTRSSYADAQGAADHGSQFNPLALARVELSATLASSWSVGVEVGMFSTLYEQQHRTATTLLWRAPHFRPLVGLTIGFNR